MLEEVQRIATKANLPITFTFTEWFTISALVVIDSLISALA